MSKDFKVQREHLREWANKHIVECDALASGLLKSPYSTVYFGDHKAMRLTGSLPGSGGPRGHYTFCFYPEGTDSAIFITDIPGNLFAPPYKITVPIDKHGVIEGTLVLYLEMGLPNWFIVVETELTTPSGVSYNGKYYLFTLPPITTGQFDTEGEIIEYHDDELGHLRIPIYHIPIGYLPVLV